MKMPTAMNHDTRKKALTNMYIFKYLNQHRKHIVKLVRTECYFQHS